MTRLIQGLGYKPRVRGNLGPIEFLQVALNLAHCQPAGVEADDLAVEPIETRHSLGHELRLEGSSPIAGHGQVDLPILGQHRLARMAVAAVAAAAAGRVALLVAQVLCQLCTQRPFHQRLLQLLEQSGLAGQILWA